MNNVWIEESEFEHLLNCMANQKFIHEQTPETQAIWQETIDKAWNDGMKTLSLQRWSKGLCNNPNLHPATREDGSYINVV